jgi:hypothetical protein
LIFEVTGGRILSLPIKNQQSSFINRQFFLGECHNGTTSLRTVIQAPCKNPPWLEDAITPAGR